MIKVFTIRIPEKDADRIDAHDVKMAIWNRLGIMVEVREYK